jgi:type I restriction enzyme S subunit
MAGEWSQTTLGEVAHFISGGTPSKARSEYWHGPIPWVSAKDMRRFRLEDTEDHISAHAVAEGAKLAPAGSVLLLCRGMTLLNDLPICMITRPMSFNQDVRALWPKAHVHKKYLPYLLLGNKDKLLSLVDLAGHGTGRLNSDDLKSLEVALPPVPEQRAIAHILGTLDDKIELNRKTAATLEAMARALFRAWFVDFEPVRAKMEGRWRAGESLPGLPAHLYDLFPARLVDSDLGEIPEGWGVRPVDELAEVFGGSTPKTERAEYWASGTHHWATPKDLSRLSVPVLLGTERKITDAGLAQISSGLLPKGVVLLSSRAPIGYLAIAEVPVAINQGLIAMKPRPGTSNLFLLRWTEATHDEIVSHANGSTFLEISKSNFRRIPVVAPSVPLMAVFDRLSRPAHLKLVELERESRTLAAIRDALLPKLVSGELRVKDAEAFLEKAGV